MADATITIGGDDKELQNMLRRAGASMRSFGDQAKKDVGGLDLGKAFAIAGGVAGLTSLIKKGFEFNQTMQDGEVAIANVLKTFKGLDDQAAKQEAAEAVSLIAQAAPQAAGGLRELTQGFIASAAAAASAGLTVAQNVDLVARFANALENSGLPLDQLNQEIRSILTANITSDSFVGKLLEGKGLNNTRIKQLIEEGNLYQTIVDLLGEMGSAGDTASVAFATLASMVEQSLGALTKDMFEQAVGESKNLTENMEAMLPTLEKIGEGFGMMVSFLASAAKMTVKITDTLAMGAFAISQAFAPEENTIEEWAKAPERILKGWDTAVEVMAEDQAAREVEIAKKRPKAPTQKSSVSSLKIEDQKTKQELAKIERDLQRVAAAREKLEERQFQTLLKSMAPMLQIEAIQKRIIQEKEKQAAADLVAPASEETQIDNKNRLLDLEDQLRDAVERRGEEEKQAAEESSRLKQGELALANELRLLEAQATGKDKIIQKVQRELQLEEDKLRIMEQTGATEEEAMRQAERMMSLRDRIQENAEDERTGRRRIRGFRRDDSAPPIFEGLKGLERMGQRRLNETFRFPGLDALEARQNPLTPLGNKAAAAAQQTKTVEQKIDLTNKILTEGLLSPT